MQTLTLTVPATITMNALREAFLAAGGTMEDVAATVASVIIDCDVLPVLPSWAKEMTTNIPGGRIDASTVGWFQTDSMKSGDYTVGTNLGSAAKGAGWKTVNATFGQRVFENQALLNGVPKEIQLLICTDSEFLSGSGRLSFVSLCRDGERWLLDFDWVGSSFFGRCAVLVTASKPSVP